MHKLIFFVAGKPILENRRNEALGIFHRSMGVTVNQNKGVGFYSPAVAQKGMKPSNPREQQCSFD
jgi:hypothetical protein